MQSLSDHLLAESEYMFAPKCSFCEQAMEISEGDIIYDSKWYHKSCWEGMDKKQAQKMGHTNNPGFASMAHYA